MAKPIYRSMFEDIIHITVEGLADWTSGSLREQAPKWQQCCCLDCSDNKHKDGHIFLSASPMAKLFYRVVYKVIGHNSFEGVNR